MKEKKEINVRKDLATDKAHRNDYPKQLKNYHKGWQDALEWVLEEGDYGNIKMEPRNKNI